MLVQNRVRPILLISFTNHALDHMLGSVLEANITRSVVRLGSRCTDERVAPYSIEELEKVSNRSRLSHYLRETFQRLKDIEKEMKDLLEEFIGSKLQPDSLNMHLEYQYEEHWDSLHNPPPWIEILFSLHTSNDEEKWRTVSQNGKAEEVDSSKFGFWLRGVDIAFLQQSSIQGSNRLPSNHSQVSESGVISTPSSPVPEGGQLSNEEDGADSDSDSYDGILEYEFKWQERLATASKDDGDVDVAAIQQINSVFPAPAQHMKSDLGTVEKGRPLSLSDLSDAEGFFIRVGEPTIPLIPTTDRSVALLLYSPDIWSMSLQERQGLAEHWGKEIREILYEAHKTRFDRLSEEHTRLRERQRSGDEEVSNTFACSAQPVDVPWSRPNFRSCEMLI